MQQGEKIGEKGCHVVIVGGGFGGIRTALDLDSCLPGYDRITLVSKNPHFEYYPGLHHIIGKSHQSVTNVPLVEIFKGTRIKIVVSAITACDPTLKTVTLENGEQVSGDYLVLGLGSQTEYFNIKGLEETAFGLKSVEQATRLRAHIDQLFVDYAQVSGAERVIGLHFVVVGGGPAGTDLAGELVHLRGVLCKQHAIPESFVTIDLIEAAPRILPMMPEKVSLKVQRRLRMLGVNILQNRNLVREGSWTIFLEDMKIGAKTLVWTAGITTNEFYTTVPGLTLVKKNRVAVDGSLQAKGFENVFVIGDAADTPYAGLAQTAIHDGSFVATAICAGIAQVPKPIYVPKPVAYNIGVGPRWSVFVIGPFVITGILAYWMRALIDFKFFTSILPLRKVIRLFCKK
ncbi:MAG: FAD-dependent oxidoreductase [Candidatus Pacebacteria bacterium]|nr:FAD-dependent oxidoreductase [Candidatus Paceibacterota bacterium]